MKTKTAKSSFDCIKFKRGVQSSIYEEIKDLGQKEQLEYFQKRASSGSFKDWWNGSRHKSVAR